MRITNGMMVSNFLNNLNKGSNKMNKLQNQMSSGKKLSRASDDPVAASKAMEIRTDLSKVKQYSNNVAESKEWLDQTESSLNELDSMLSRAYELTNNAANGTNGDNERNAIADEIEQLSEQIVNSANTTFKSQSIFGGNNTTGKPFEIKDVAGEKALFYNGQNVNDLDNPANAAQLNKLKSEHVSYEIGFGTNMDISYNGIELLGSGDNNVFSVLNNLVGALRNGDTTAIQNSVDSVKGKQDEIISKIGEIGGKQNRLDSFAKRLSNDEYNYEVIQENTEGIDVEKTIMELKMQEATYEAALSAGSKVIMPTLVDFLK